MVSTTISFNMKNKILTILTICLTNFWGYSQCGDSNPISSSDLCGEIMEFNVSDELYKLRYCSNHSLNSVNSNVKRAIIWVHGSCRNSQDKYNDLISSALSHSVDLDSILIVTPQFLSLIDLQESSLNLDASYIYWTNYWNGWKYGYKSVNDPSFPNNSDISSYSVMDSIVQRINDKFPSLETIVIGGHSAGGQLMNRYAASNSSEEQYRNINFLYLVSNPATYLYFNDERAVNGTTNVWHVPTGCNNFDRYKYGLANLNGCPYMINATSAKATCQFRERKISYLIGQNDTSPTSSDCRELLQGDHRLERGNIYYNYLQHFYGAEITNRHFLEIIPGVGHSSTGVMNSVQGKYRLFDWPGTEIVSLDCSCHQDLDLPGNPTIKEGVYEAMNTIASTGMVLPGDNVEYKVGNSIELNQGFEIKLGSMFLGEIIICN